MASDEQGKCHNCGAAVPVGARFCEECGAPLGGACHCVSCGAEVAPGMAICPVCGHPATTSCTFCGATMSAGERFCPECGNPRGGIICPQCNTLNFRSFCRHCNTALNPMARYAQEQARRDPRYIHAQSIADEIANLEAEIRRLETAVESAPVREAPAEPERTLDVDDSLSEETRRLLEEFRKLSGHPGTPAPAPKREAKPKPKPAEPKPLTLSAEKATVSRNESHLEELREQFRSKLGELQQALDAMVPDPSDPPEIQRNFACAHKVTLLTTTTETRKKIERIAWVCNRCHIWHNNPSECGVAEFGGKWVTKELSYTVTRESSTDTTINL